MVNLHLKYDRDLVNGLGSVDNELDRSTVKVCSGVLVLGTVINDSGQWRSFNMLLSLLNFLHFFSKLTLMIVGSYNSLFNCDPSRLADSRV